MIRRSILPAIILFASISMASLAIGCGSTPEPAKNKEVNTEEESVPEPETETIADDVPDNTETEEEAPGNTESPQDIPDSTKVSENTAEEDPVFTTPEDVLEHFSSTGENVSYLLYDVDADGKEELFIMDRDRILEIYGYYKDHMQPAFTNYTDSEITLYPEGMMKLTASDTAEYSETTWYQYNTELGDFLPAFQDLEGEYYTFCSYSLDEEEMAEVRQSLEDTGYYPAWLGEWDDMITKKEYDGLVPKTKPVKLPEADSLSDRSALETRPEYLLYVKAADGYANLRTGPGTEYEIISQMPNGDELEVYLRDATSESGKTWLKVAYFVEADNEDGYAWLTGWVAESQLE